MLVDRGLCSGWCDISCLGASDVCGSFALPPVDDWLMRLDGTLLALSVYFDSPMATLFGRADELSVAAEPREAFFVDGGRAWVEITG
jgi:hypothetical protein